MPATWPVMKRPSTRAPACPLRGPGAVGELPERGCGLGNVAGGEGADAQRAAGDPVIAAPADQVAAVKPGGGEDVEGEPEHQHDGSGAEKPTGAVTDRQRGSEHGECFGGGGEDEGDPGRRGLPVPQDRRDQQGLADRRPRQQYRCGRVVVSAANRVPSTAGAAAPVNAPGDLASRSKRSRW